ncbi:Hsp33 family molecular chaperone HslO [Mechercharimyces sp. CAU 1602]|uniref:Hsp33 family molecular chaperone HslO n=1 Tax=Mechercharimyces sp. CAU 1602 TaxID=2973933 RepID=UPI002161735E|nr:Hsp33 family molecular chaperone HslO [Mechercharimyces sp. CAU 1602]MCS1352397.1 Hsp33 family molecular chaperone HslO [Mechercharimyces sp. CAU 1602]
MEDYGIRVTAADGQIRGFAVQVTGILNELHRRHHTYPIASAALGRTLSVGAMMGMMLKDERHQLTIQIQGDGPLGPVVVDADASGHVRGYVQNSDVELPPNAAGKLNVGAGIGQGMIHVIKDLGLKDPYRGSSPIQSGEIGDDFSYYFTMSEQIPSAVGVGVLVDTDASIRTAGGFLIQVMPGADEQMVEQVEQQIHTMPAVTKAMDEGATPEDLLQMLLGDSMKVLDKTPLHFHCKCSYERIRTMLQKLGAEEIRAIIEEQGSAEVICHFCNEPYQLSKEELESLLPE